MYFLRITHDTELFKTSKRTTTISIVIGDIDREDREFDLEFEIVKPSSISNAYYKVRASAKSQFNEYSEHLSQQKIPLSKAIFIYQTRPVANILVREPIMNMGQISKKIKTGKSQEVLRNKIVIGRTEEQIQKLKDDIKDIVKYEFDFDFVNSSKKEIDEYLDLKVKIEGKNLDLHLQGSGFLQVAEIFSTIRYIDAPLSILLVDEPDSHIQTTFENILSRILYEETNENIELILEFIRIFKQKYYEDLKDTTSNLYQEMKKCFIGQKKDSRPELTKIDFDEFVNDCYEEGSIKLHYVMNKNQIKKFVNRFNEHFNCQLLTIEEDKSEEYASKLFSLYISKIHCFDQIYPSHKKMLQTIYAEVNKI